MFTINPFYHLAKISKFSINYGESVVTGISVPQGVMLRCVPTQMEILVCSPLLCEKVQGALGWALFMK